MTTATATAPYYATNTVNGADVQACTSQVGCDTDTADTCTTGPDVTKLKCDALEAGYSSDGDGAVTPVACPANTNGANLPAGCASNTGWHGVVVATSIFPHYYTVDLDGTGADSPVEGGAMAQCTAQATGCDVSGTECMAIDSEHYDKLKCTDPAEGFWINGGLGTVR